MRILLILICIAGSLMGFPIAFAGSQADTSPFEQQVCLFGGSAMVILGIVALALVARGVRLQILAAITSSQALLFVFVAWLGS